MSESIELCALREGYWDLISTYPPSQEGIAIKEAANIQTGYAAVAVLSVEKMHIAYYITLRNIPKPTYYDIRKSVKAERPTMRQKTKPKKTTKPAKSQDKTTSAPAENAPKPVAAALEDTHELSFFEKLIDSLFYLLTGKHVKESPHSKTQEKENSVTSVTSQGEQTLSGEPVTDSQQTEENTLENLLETQLEEEAEVSPPSEDTVPDTAQAPDTHKETKAPPPQDAISAKNPFKAKEENKNTSSPLMQPPEREKKNAALKNTKASLPKIGGGHIPNPSTPQKSQSTQDKGTAFWNNIAEDEDDFESIRLQIQKSLFGAIERAKQLAWLPEQSTMRGTLQLASILLICGIGRKLCSHVGVPGGLGNQVIADTLEQLGLSDKQAFICALHVDRILSDHKNNLMYLIGRAYGANILNDTEQRIDLLSIFNAWEANELEKYFEVDEEKNTAKLSKLPYLKAISILLTDIVNFTGQSNEKGEKWVKDVVHAHNRMTKTITAHQKGEYIQGTGDGALLIFTSPQAAMHAALELQFMHQNFCRRVASRHFDIRVAVSHGIPIQTQSGLHGPPIEELHMIHKEMGDIGIAVTKGIANIAEQHGFQFNLNEETAFPIYEFTTYTGAHTVSDKDQTKEQHAETPAEKMQEEGQQHV
jgi:hypothetical protein